MTIAGGALIVMITAAPLPSPVQLASLTLTTLRVMELVALMLRDDDDELIPLWTRPSDHWTVHGPLPVSVNGTLMSEGPQAERVAGTVMVGPDVMATSADEVAPQLFADTVTARCTLPLAPAV